jgi:hypothetical protein
MEEKTNKNMLNIPFVKNPGGQCGQTCMVMALKYYFPDKECSIEQMDLIMLWEAGKWTFPYQNAVVLDELGLKVKSFSSVDVPIDRKKMVESFKKRLAMITMRSLKTSTLMSANIL